MQIMWFKRDLRIEDNSALSEAAKRGPVLPLYILEKDLTEKKLLAYGMPASFQTLNLEISRPETLPTEIVKITYNHPEDIFLKERRKFQVVSSIPQRSFSSVRNKGLLEISYLALIKKGK